MGVGESVKKESGKDFCLDAKYGYIHSCPTNLGTGMRASVHVDLPGWTKYSVDKLKERCEELQLQPRVPEERVVVRLATPMISPTSTDWDTLRLSLSRR